MLKNNGWLSYIPKVVWYSLSFSIIVLAGGFTYKAISSQSCSVEIPNKLKVVMNDAVSSVVNATSTAITVNEELFHGIEQWYEYHMDDSGRYQIIVRENGKKSKSDGGESLPKTNSDISLKENLRMSKDKMQESIQQMKEAQKALEELKF